MDSDLATALAKINEGIEVLEKQQEELFLLLGGRMGRHETETDARFCGREPESTGASGRYSRFAGFNHKFETPGITAVRKDDRHG